MGITYLFSTLTNAINNNQKRNNNIHHNDVLILDKMKLIVVKYESGPARLTITIQHNNYFHAIYNPPNIQSEKNDLNGKCSGKFHMAV